nr:hypothetical protein [Sphingomonas sp. Y57]
MPNTIRGETPLPPCSLAGWEEGATLQFTIDALAAAEGELRQPIEAALKRSTPIVVRALLRAALRSHHGHISRAAAGALVKEMGIDAVGPALIDALSLAFPASSGGGKAEEGEPWDWLKCFEIWCEMGHRPDDFWAQTPRLFACAVRAHSNAAQIRSDQRAWLAWTTAALGRAKTLPPLKRLLSRRKPVIQKGKAKPWEDQLAAWTKMLARK